MGHPQQPQELGELLREARKRAGLTLDKVAASVGITPGALSHIEVGKRLPDPRNAVAIAQVLDLPEELVMQALDEQHARRRRDYVDKDRGTERTASVHPSAAAYSQRPIAELFQYRVESAPAEDAHLASPARRNRTSSPQRAESFGHVSEREMSSLRSAARWSDDTKQRLMALERLGDNAADALRTLKGLASDDDPLVAKEAVRLLHELGVQLDR